MRRQAKTAWPFCDMVWCEVRYGIGYLDYHVFGFANRRGAGAEDL